MTGWIRHHWASVRRYLRILGADSAAAEDLAQDVFVIALRKGMENRGAPTAAWLRRSARNRQSSGSASRVFANCRHEFAH